MPRPAISIPLSDTKFFVEAYGSRVEFVREKAGPVTHLLYRNIRAAKINPQPCPPEALAAYAGDYWSDELRVTYRLEIRHGELGFWQRPAGWVRLLAIGPDRFDTEAETAIEFVRNPASQVTGMNVTGERVHNLRFTRVSLPELELTVPK